MQSIPPHQSKQLSRLLLAQADMLTYEGQVKFETGFTLGLLLSLELMQNLEEITQLSE